MSAGELRLRGAHPLTITELHQQVLSMLRGSCAGVGIERSSIIFTRPKGEDGSVWTFEIELDQALGPLGSHRWVTMRRAPIHRLRAEVLRFERYRELGQTWSAPLPAWQLDEPNELLLTTFPFDRRLVELPWWLRPRALSRMIGSSHRPGDRVWRIRKRKASRRILSYRPERRTVVRWDLCEKDDASGETRSRSIVVRMNASGYSGSLSVYEALEKARMAAPRLIAAPDDQIRVEAFIEGQALDYGEIPGGDELEAAGALIGRCHACVYRPSGLSPVDENEILNAAAVAIRNLQSARPATARIAQDLCDRLRQTPMPRANPVFLHGDLHSAQFLRLGKVGSLALVDFDRAASGDPAIDLAGFLAHLEAHGAPDSALERVRIGYASEAELPNYRSLEWHRRAAILRWLDLGDRRPTLVAPDWSDRLVHLLRREDER